MYQAIVTKFIGPTTYKGSRVKAACEAGHVTTAWDYALSSEENHVQAALALATKLGWSGRWIGGALNAGYVFVSTRDENEVGKRGPSAGCFEVAP